MDSSTINDRIIQFIKYLGFELEMFSEICQVSAEYILNGELAPESPELNKILGVYPELNPQWLRFGFGSMLGIPMNRFGEIDENFRENEIQIMLRLNMSKEKIDKEIFERYEIYRGYIRACMSKIERDTMRILLYQSRHIAISTICQNYPNLNREWLELGIGEMVHSWSAFGEAYGTKSMWNSEILSASDKMTANWALRSYGFRWAMRCVRHGVSTSDIFSIFKEAQSINPPIMTTRDGSPLSSQVFESWIRISTKLLPKFLNS